MEEVWDGELELRVINLKIVLNKGVKEMRAETGPPRPAPFRSDAPFTPSEFLPQFQCFTFLCGY